MMDRRRTEADKRNNVLRAGVGRMPLEAVGRITLAVGGHELTKGNIGDHRAALFGSAVASAAEQCNGSPVAISAPASSAGRGRAKW